MPSVTQPCSLERNNMSRERDSVVFLSFRIIGIVTLQSKDHKDQMKTFFPSIQSFAVVSMLAVNLGFAATVQAATLAVDLTVNNSGTISDGTNTATFIFDKQQPTGTGVLDPFLRVQRNGTEQGYNTTVANAGQLPFEEKFGIWTHDLLFSSMQEINGSYNFVLDIGEPVSDNTNKGQESLLSLDGLKFYVTNTPGQNSNSVDVNGDANGIVGTLLWDMDAQADNFVLLNSNRDGNPGNGVSDMLLQVPTSVFAGVSGNQYIILWSRFGLQNASNSGAESFGTFEEWAQLNDPQYVPEPATLVLLGIAALGFAYRRRAK